MGVGEDVVAVADAGPLIHLAEIESLPLLAVCLRIHIHTGRISLQTAEDCIERLYSVSSLFVTKTIADMAIEQLHRKPS